AGDDTALLAKRHQVYQAAKAKYPERWSGNTRNREPVQKVLLNPDNANENTSTVERAA
ncbi:MAG: IS3 family transposase, partial [Proteobacteria bacterium]|nr:IS3 family transposase [Pseudomonadota bacterium]